MTSNDLHTGTTRLGWFEDGLPDEVTPPTACLLRNDGRRITLTIPWRNSGTNPDQIRRWFSGAGVLHADDPDRSHFQYEVPRELSFHDVDGDVALAGCSSGGAQSRWGGAPGASVGQGTVNVRFAIFGGHGLKWGRIHGLRTEIPGLAGWASLSAVTEEVEKDERKFATALKISIRSPRAVPLSRSLNLRLVPSWRTSLPSDAYRTIHDELFIETRAHRDREWEEHFAVHNSVRDLLDLAAWQPFGYRRILALRDDDSRQLPSGENQDVWRDAETYATRPPGTNEATARYLFGFEHAGASGLRGWQNLRSAFGRGITPLMGLLDIVDAFVENSVIQCSTGLEAVGLQLAIESGMAANNANKLTYEQRLGHIESALPFAPILGGWPSRAASAYNSIKHANRPLPDPIAMTNALTENVIVFRIWAASRIGVPADVLRTRIDVDRGMQQLRVQGLAPTESA